MKRYHPAEFHTRCLVDLAHDDIRLGIDLHYELIKSRKYQIFNNTCKFLIDELESYHWPSYQDLSPDKDDKNPNPVKQFDHCCDCLRYLTTALYRSNIRRDIKVAQEVEIVKQIATHPRRDIIGKDRRQTIKVHSERFT